jgi:hypothetical protein
MKGAYMLGLFVLVGCASEGFRGDTPAISLTRPGGDIKVETQEGNTIYDAESNGPENRSCAFVVRNSEGDV